MPRTGAGGIGVVRPLPKGASLGQAGDGAGCAPVHRGDSITGPALENADSLKEDGMAHPTDLVDAQVKAFRERDLEQFLGYYSEHSVIKDGDGNVMMSGIESIREIYGQLFQGSPQLAVNIPNRIAVGEYVIHEEQIDGFNLSG
jgi:hypothetical protein